jgi:hypothetical protein
LGRYGAKGSAEKVYTTIPTNASKLTLNFDFYEIDSWDSESFSVEINCVKILLGKFLYGTNEGNRTGVVGDVQFETRATVPANPINMGFGSFADQIHHVTINLPSRFVNNGFLKVNFSSTLDQDFTDEAFGIDNIKITAYQCSSSQSVAPTPAPITASPTPLPTFIPTALPTVAPTKAPITASPTPLPTFTPTHLPTVAPTKAPITASPTPSPTFLPTALPTLAPTRAPITASPTPSPTFIPTALPTVVPTRAPITALPTVAPTVVPTTTAPTVCAAPSPSGAVSTAVSNCTISSVAMLDDFEISALTGWTNGKVENSSTAFTSFLGRYGASGSAEKVYTTIPTNASKLTLNFDFYEIDSWDGESFSVEINCVTILLGTFLYGTNEGNRTGVVGDVQFETRATVHGAPINMGFGSFADQIHHVTINLPSRFVNNGLLKVKFSSTLNQDLTDEAFGIDNIKITAYQCS